MFKNHLKYLGIGGLAAFLAMPGVARASAVIYDSIPSPLPQSVVSLGYECCSASEVGNQIQFAGTDRALGDVTVTMDNWAYQAAYPGFGNAAGYTVPMTLTLYDVGPSGSVGTAIASRTINAFIKWRPNSDGCGDYGSGYMVGDTCYNGLAENVTFNFSGVTVPDQIVYGLAFNTEDYGAEPTGVGGPYDSLNIGLDDTDPTIGTNSNPGEIDWETSYAGFLTTGTVNVFGPDAGWAPYSPAVQFGVPEPATFGLLGVGLLGLGAIRRRRNG